MVKKIIPGVTVTSLIAGISIIFLKDLLTDYSLLPLLIVRGIPLLAVQTIEIVPSE